jgi:hypothetical protein
MMRNELIELINQLRIANKISLTDIDTKTLVNSILADGWRKPPCKVGDTVYITRIDGLNEDSSPIFKIEQGRVYQISIDNTKDTIWIGADFGILHCCRPYTDFYYTKEAAEKALAEKSAK